jgi:ABC-type multidrug transport system ATPase subunit
VLVIDEGRVVAAGSLDELFAARGDVRWELEAADPHGARAWLAERGHAAETEGGRLLLHLREPPEEILAGLATAGVGLRQFRRRDSLEELLLGSRQEAAR